MNLRLLIMKRFFFALLAFVCLISCGSPVKRATNEFLDIFSPSVCQRAIHDELSWDEMDSITEELILLGEEIKDDERPLDSDDYEVLSQFLREVMERADHNPKEDFIYYKVHLCKKVKDVKGLFSSVHQSIMLDHGRGW